ncbi:DHA2 family efflux MFS transporter permease subunit [Streptomyces sp. NPDC006617]|uniref:MFS transporter n=1 Tax=Streptomyces sp. NPDC006617 TaxID=3155354 RepID=UPI0033AF20C1
MSTPNDPAHQSGRATGTPRPVHRWLVLAICCLSVGVTGINLTIVNVALPSISEDLHASLSSLQWTVSAYSLVMACLLLLSGSMADRLGRKRIFQLGLALFSLGSLLCGLAPSVGWLIAFVCMQGVGGSMLNPVAMSIIVSVFTDRGERARAIGVWGSVIGVTMAAGPVLGGLLVGGIDWRSVYWVNVPVGIVAIVLAHRFVPESRAARARAFDPLGQALMVVLFASIITATIEGPDRGWTDPWVVGMAVMAVMAVIGILLVEPRRSEPLIDLRFFRSPPFSAANLISVLMTASLGGFLFLNTLYLQDIRDFSPLHAGLMIVPMAVGQAVAANVSGRLVASQGPRLSLTLGGALLALGGFLLLALAIDTKTIYLLATYAIFGLGAGMVSPPVTNTAVSGMPPDQVGVAGALVASSRQFGSGIGVAVTGSIVAGPSARFIDSSHAAWALLGGCGLAVLALGVISTSNWAKAVAAHNAQRLDTVPVPKSQSHPLAGRSVESAEARPE